MVRLFAFVFSLALSFYILTLQLRAEDVMVVPNGGGISAFDGDVADAPNYAERILESGISGKADVAWSFGVKDTGIGEQLEAVVMESCPLCAQVPRRPPRCSRSLGGTDDVFLSYETSAGVWSEFLNNVPKIAPSYGLNEVYIVIDGINPKREIEPRPRPCR